MPKLSIVIHLYNAEHFLRRCLNAVCRQTLHDIEIICVNDGSTDNSESIVLEYAAKDGRIKLVSFPANSGVAVAHNRVLGEAQGEYLGFVRSDYEPSLDFYEKLHAKAVETGADVVKGNYRYWGLDGRSLPVFYGMNEAIRDHKTNFSFTFCSAIYRRCFILNHSLMLPEEPIDIADTLFTLKVALLCNAVEIVDDAEVNIRGNAKSPPFNHPDIVHILTKFTDLSRILDILNAQDTLAPQSYGFTIAVLFKGAIMEAVQNKTPQAYRIIVDSLHGLSRKIKQSEHIAVAFIQLGLSELHTVLASSSFTQLAAYTAAFYDNRLFVVRDLRFRALSSPQAKRKEACVVIPVYIAQLNTLETASLHQCLKVLGEAHQIIFFGPQSLDTRFFESMIQEYGLIWRYEAFEDAYFSSPLTYSTLLLSPSFYGRFTQWEYLLVYQLDSWVFQDELSMWCAKGWDYIGAPWFKGYSEAETDSELIFPSGNGGFSLRKILPFIECLNSLETKTFTKDNSLDCYAIDAAMAQIHEDVVLVNVFPKLNASFTIAPAEESMRFSFEMFPERLYAMTGQLPFGCHAHSKYSPEFWAAHIIFPKHSNPGSKC